MKASSWRICCGLIVIAVLAGVVYKDNRLDAAWRVELKRMEREEAAWEARDFSRRPLHSSHHGAGILDENAWPHLRLAATLTREASTRWKSTHQGQTLHGHIVRYPDHDLAAEEDLLRQALDELRVAARCSFARVPVRWKDGTSHGTLPLFHTQLLTHVLMASARSRANQGFDEEAALLLADALSLGRDLAHGSATHIEDVLGNSLIQLVCNTIAASESFRSLDRIALAQLATCLETLDEDLVPCGPSMRANFLLLRNSLTSPPTGMAGVDRGEVLGALRWVEELTDLAQRSAELPWEQVQQLWSAAPKNNWLTGEGSATASAGWLRVLEQRRNAQAVVRMTRMVVAERLHEKWSALPDPFGSELLWSRAAGRLEIWTAKSNSPSGAPRLSALLAE